MREAKYRLIFTHRGVIALATAILIQGTCGLHNCRGAEVPDTVSHIGSFSCNAVACHGATDDYSTPNPKARTEFATWMHADPHARSKETIYGEKFETILQ